MSLEIERRYKIHWEKAERQAKRAEKTHEMQSAYASPAKFPILVHEKGGAITAFNIANCRVEVPPEKQEELAEILERDLVNKEGLLNRKCTVRIREAHNLRTETRNYKLTIKTDLPEKELNALIKSAPVNLRGELRKFRFNGEWEFRFDGARLFTRLVRNESADVLRKIRYDLPDGWDLEKELGNKKGDFTTDLWIAEIELDPSNILIPTLPPWMAGATPLRGLGSKKLAAIDPNKLEAAVAEAIRR